MPSPVNDTKQVIKLNLCQEILELQESLISYLDDLGLKINFDQLKQKLSRSGSELSDGDYRIKDTDIDLSPETLETFTKISKKMSYLTGVLSRDPDTEKDPNKAQTLETLQTLRPYFDSQVLSAEKSQQKAIAEQSAKKFTDQLPLTLEYLVKNLFVITNSLADQELIVNDSYTNRFHWKPSLKDQKHLSTLPQFFKDFIPMQYEKGWGWRCDVIRTVKPEERVAGNFDELKHDVKKIVAGNAEIMLRLFTELCHPEELEKMREIGSEYLEKKPQNLKFKFNLQYNAPNNCFADYGEIEKFLVQIGERHHTIWAENFTRDIEQGRRDDPHHAGRFQEFHDLPQEEQKLVLPLQSLANCRILAMLDEASYDLLRDACINNVFLKAEF